MVSAEIRSVPQKVFTRPLSTVDKWVFDYKYGGKSLKVPPPSGPENPLHQ